MSECELNAASRLPRQECRGQFLRRHRQEHSPFSPRREVRFVLVGGRADRERPLSLATGMALQDAPSTIAAAFSCTIAPSKTYLAATACRLGSLIACW
jgi:hypothetical protein